MCRMDYAYFTDKGDREHNEDYIGFSEAGDKKIFVLADGLGGHGKGEVASCLVVENVKSMLNDNNVKDEKFLDNCFVMSQKCLLDEQKKSNSNGKMKTTLVILYIDGTTAKYGHIGDSRLYVVKNGKIQKRTIDHSVPQMLALAGEIREKDIRHHEDRNRLLRAMGNEWDDSSPKYEIDDTLDIEKGMSFLLCSDGFWEWITEKEMEKCLCKGASSREALDMMVERVKKSGKNKNMDNYSAILIRFE